MQKDGGATDLLVENRSHCKGRIVTGEAQTNDRDPLRIGNVARIRANRVDDRVSRFLARQCRPRWQKQATLHRQPISDGRRDIPRNQNVAELIEIGAHRLVLRAGVVLL